MVNYIHQGKFDIVILSLNDQMEKRVNEKRILIEVTAKN